MPTATPELKAIWEKENAGDGEVAACLYLENRGWVLDKEWLWHPPSKDHTVAPQEIRAIAYLIQEWDYGGLWKEEERPNAKNS